MTMKSVYIVYITNCFLWTMSDNKTHLILSYLILSYLILIKLILSTIQLINPKASGSIPAPQSRYATTIIEFLLIYSSKMTFEANGT